MDADNLGQQYTYQEATSSQEQTWTYNCLMYFLSTFETVLFILGNNNLNDIAFIFLKHSTIL